LFSENKLGEIEISFSSEVAEQLLNLARNVKMISQKKPSSSQPAVKNRQVIIKKQCSIYSFFSTLDFVAGDLIYPFFNI